MESFLKNFDLTVLDAQMIVVWGVLFIVFWQIMARVVFQPLITVVEARDAATTGAEEGAHKLTQEAEALKVKAEDKLAEVRVSAMKEKLAELAKARTQAQQLVDEAEKTAQSQIARSRQELSDRLTKLRIELEQEANEMARSIVSKVKSAPEVRTN